MKIFHCDHCQNLLFFENIQCVHCDHKLAFLPDAADLRSLEEAGENLWRSPADKGRRTYRLCANYTEEKVCNWAIPVEDPNPLCRSCRLTRVIPDLAHAGMKEAWYRLEVAKRRLTYSLLALGLRVTNKIDDPAHGIAYEFLADGATPGAPLVLTGHDNGVIVINVAEADDAEREKRRLQMHEPYRTLLGHFRHEVGHYYWDDLIRDGDRLDAFRKLFGDERQDYAEALKNNYSKGPPQDWQENYISTYAASHPWEDWAETWAHYLHMTDALETAAACGLSLRPRRRDEPSLKAAPVPVLRVGRLGSFDQMIEAWFPLTYVLNNLNRGLGLSDGYPFLLPTPVIEKLRFVHETIDSAT